MAKRGGGGRGGTQGEGRGEGEEGEEEESYNEDTEKEATAAAAVAEEKGSGNLEGKDPAEGGDGDTLAERCKEQAGGLDANGEAVDVEQGNEPKDLHVVAAVDATKEKDGERDGLVLANLALANALLVAGAEFRQTTLVDGQAQSAKGVSQETAVEKATTSSGPLVSTAVAAGVRETATLEEASEPAHETPHYVAAAKQGTEASMLCSKSAEVRQNPSETPVEECAEGAHNMQPGGEKQNITQNDDTDDIDFEVALPSFYDNDVELVARRRKQVGAAQSAALSHLQLD